MPKDQDWSRAEVEATVASYFEMLEKALRGESYNKAAHNRQLRSSLDGRSKGAVEYKYQNVTAVLIDLNTAWISGYKPAKNYQQLLREVVVRQLEERRDLRTLMEEVALRDPDPPPISDILAALTDPPEVHDRRPVRSGGTFVRPALDYFALEAANRRLGLLGEKFVLEFERARLEAAGQSRLAAQIRHVSVERGDGLGYDIESYEVDSRERLIEVKTTKLGEYTPFYVSRNELRVSKKEAPRYHLYRVHSFEIRPRLFTMSGSLDTSFALEASTYMARLQ